MKNLFVITTLLLISAISFGQTPEKMSYQAVLRDSGGNLLPNQVVGMQISILQTTASGTAVYAETQNPTTNVNGLVTLEIGAGNIVSGDFTSIDWSAGPYFIKTDYDLTSGTSYTISGIGQFLSVPNAEHAKNGVPTDGTDGQILMVNSSGEAEWITMLKVSTFYADTDGDGFGDIYSTYVAVSAPSGYVSANTDCDDTDGNTYPGAPELCDDKDNNCNGAVDEGLPFTTYYADADSDGYGDPDNTISTCDGAPTGYLTNNSDCDDTNVAINPVATEIARDGKDNNCDGTVDEGFLGQLRDGGVVFWVDPADNTHGLVCGFNDYYSIKQWGCYQTDLPNVPNVTYICCQAHNPNGPGAEIGDGKNNTDKIIEDCTGGDTAANAARTFGPEWFLPSIKELKEMYSKRYIINTASTANGGTAFKWDYYWSSTEESAQESWSINFHGSGSGYFDPIGSGTLNLVRPIRAF